MDIKFFKKIKLPNKPGVYFFKKKEEILYIGKATSLKERVKSYFGKNLIETRGPLLVDLLFKADKIDWQETDSILEALILEANLIKKYQPKYNTKEKSDKSFNYVCITKDKKIAVVRGKILNKEKYNNFFGPFPNGNQLREALKIIRKIFPFFDGKKGAKGREEFYKQIKLVPLSQKENENNIKNIQLLFKGKKNKILKNLKKEMEILAKEQKFEKAREIKKQIFALQHINDVALLKNETINYKDSFRFTRQNPTGSDTNKIYNSLFRVEAYDIAHMSGKNMVGAMVVLEDEELRKDKYRKFKINTQQNTNDTGALEEMFTRRLAHTEWSLPDLIVLDGSTAQINAVSKILKKNNLKIKIVAVTKDEKHKAREIKGDKKISQKYKSLILLANAEAHRFAISYHKKLRSKNFLI